MAYNAGPMTHTGIFLGVRKHHFPALPFSGPADPLLRGILADGTSITVAARCCPLLAVAASARLSLPG